MKEVIIPPIPIGDMSLDEAFHKVFGEPTLQKVHGPTLKVSDWKNKQRKVQFSLEVRQIPPEIRRFFCGDRFRITTRQTRIDMPAQIDVKNKIRMHFVGAEFFCVKPCFRLQQHGCQTYISGRVEHHAILPPPLNIIAETFMAEQSKREMEHFGNVLRSS